MGVVYMIRPKIPHKKNHIYIGSTIKTVESRYKEHMLDYDKWLIGKQHHTSSIIVFSRYGFDNCECVVLDTIEDKTELRKKEKEYIKNTTCVNIQKGWSTMTMRYVLNPNIPKPLKPIKPKPITIQDIWKQNSTFTPYPIRL